MMQFTKEYNKHFKIGSISISGGMAGPMNGPTSAPKTENIPGQQVKGEQPLQQDKGGQPAPEKKIMGKVTIKLVSFPEDKKLIVLKNIRKLKPGMNIMDSKKLIDALPSILQKDLTPEQAKEWETLLKEGDAKYELINE